MKCGLICARRARTSASMSRVREASSSASSSCPDTQRATSFVARTRPAEARPVKTCSVPTTFSSTSSGATIAWRTMHEGSAHPTSAPSTTVVRPWPSVPAEMTTGWWAWCERPEVLERALGGRRRQAHPQRGRGQQRRVQGAVRRTVGLGAEVTATQQRAPRAHADTVGGHRAPAAPSSRPAGPTPTARRKTPRDGVRVDSGVVALVGGDVPEARATLGLELLLRGRAGGVAVLLGLALLVTGGPRGLREPQVGAPGAEQLGAGLQGRLPVEDDGVLSGTDDDGVAGHGADLVELLLDTETAEPVGEVADGLVVGEVGLAHPAIGALAGDPEDRPVRTVLLDDAEALVVDGLGAQHDAFRHGGLGLDLGAGGIDVAGHREAQLAQALVGHCG